MIANFGLWSANTQPLIYSFQSSYQTSIEQVLLNSIFGAVGFIGVVLGLYVMYIYRKEQVHNIFLGIFTLTTSLILLELVFYWFGFLDYIPKIPLYKSTVFLWGPTLYLYFVNKSESVNNNPIKTVPLIKHYCIFALSLILLIILDSVDLDTTTSYSEIMRFTSALLTNYWIKLIYFTFYLVLILNQYFQDKKQLSKMGRNWAKTLISFFSFIFLIVIIRAEFSDFYKWDYLSKYLAAYVFSAFIIVMLILNILLPKDRPTNSNTRYSDKKYKNSGLTPAMAITVKEQLIEIMEEKKIYLDHTLNLQYLADALNIDRYSLSQVINEKFGKNFYEFVNDYRIKESINLIKNNPERIELVTDLVYESGFNNKVSFYKAFKKRKKKTPSQYIKEYMEAV